jgi:hypothetical protein
MRSRDLLLGAALAASFVFARAAHAGSFDARGVFSFDPSAVVTLDFSSFSAAADAGDGSAKAVADSTALAGGHVLSVKLATEGYPIPLTLPKRQGSYHLTFWLKGDCTGGFAADYADGSPGVVSNAFPTGRVTSDGWVEMQTQPFSVDGTKSGVDARLFLAAYSISQPITVQVDAVEVVPDGTFTPRAACVGLDTAGACGAGQMCLGGLCRDARGWFPPFPSDGERTQIVDYWKQKIHDTFGPYALRERTLPVSLATLDEMTQATDNVAFWGRLAEAIRQLKDAHTYVRIAALSDVKPLHPLNACFFQGVGDLSQAAAPSVAGLPDILVSHAGTTDTWGLKQGDRLVSIDGQHPLTWARTLMTPSPWYWEADDPNQIANVLALLNELIERHATTITVVHCDASAGTCDAAPQTIRVADLPVASSKDDPDMVVCDNRPFAEVSGEPADHDYGNDDTEPAVVIQGPLIDPTPSDDIYGVVWDSLLGDGRTAAVDQALSSAVQHFAQSRGALLDHREGYGGTSQTANILISFARTPYTPFIGIVRTRADDEGPADASAAEELFNHYKSQSDVFGSANAHTDIPVALLTTWDVSASDYLLQIMKGGPDVQLFGPGPSMGAFGTFMQYSLWGVMHWSISIEDAIAPDGTLLTSHGVVPDQVVVPTESDLLAGKDTVEASALDWLRTELKQP